MTDNQTRQLAEQILLGMKELHEEQNPSTPLIPGTPVVPHAAAERIGISPVGHRYAAALKYLEEEGALQPNTRPGDVEGDPRYVLGARGPKLMERESKEPHSSDPSPRPYSPNRVERVFQETQYSEHPQDLTSGAPLASSKPGWC